MKTYRSLLELTPKREGGGGGKDVHFIKRDWNAKGGSQEILEVTGKFGLGVQNEAGQSLPEYLPIECTCHSKHPLPITPEKTLYTWTSPHGQHQNQIDYILCSRRWRSSIQSAKARQGDDCGSHHEFLVEKFRVKLKKLGKPKDHSVMT